MAGHAQYVDFLNLVLHGPTMKSYVPELDGVRAIAVISVMIFHLGIFPIGWMGVPLFFVLSGYLITSILMSDRSSEIRHYAAKFFWRRSVRIFPLYYVYLIINLILSIIAGLSIAGYGYFLFYLGNYRIGALAPNVPGGVIGHLWSVAVEEQFYLIWPWLIYYVKKPAYLAAASIILAPLARESIYDITNNPYMTIVSLPSCIDMLGAGALVALVRRRAVFGAMLAAGGVIVGYCLWQVPIADFAHTEKWVPQAHIMYTGLGLLTAPLIACAGRIRVLALPPLRYVGRISYGLYMWHLIVFAIVHRMKLPIAIEATASIAASFVVASLSWHFFERRFLALKDRMFADRTRRETTLARD